MNSLKCMYTKGDVDNTLNPHYSILSYNSNSNFTYLSSSHSNAPKFLLLFWFIHFVETARVEVQAHANESRLGVEVRQTEVTESIAVGSMDLKDP